MQTNELILYLREKVKNAKERKIQTFSELIPGDKLLEAADRLEELEGECKSLAKTVIEASDTLRKRNEKLTDMEKIAAFYHRELERKCKEGEKPKPKPKNRSLLKRCPFCGGKARIMKCPVGMYSGCFIVGCDKNNSCFGNVNHMTKIFLSKEAAAESWNRRAGDNESQFIKRG